MPTKRIILLLLSLLSIGGTGCLKNKPAVLSGGEYYPDGITVIGRGTYNPDQTSRRYRVPVYVVPSETLEALLSE